MVDTISTAFHGSVEMSLPFFCGEGWVCNTLLPVVGDVRMEEVGVRWRIMVAANSRTAIEFTECWEELQGEAREMATYLGEELEGQLA